MPLLRLLEVHTPEDADESRSLAEMRRMLPQLAHPLSRNQMPAHFTASALLVDIAAGRVALLHHAKLDKWLQPGGHVEAIDEGLVHYAALREATEETGCAVHLYHDPPTLLDVDVHLIPARADEPAHHHLDLRFLVVAKDPQALALNAAESLAVQWFSFDAAMSRAADPPLRRMIRKAQSILGR